MKIQEQTKINEFSIFFKTNYGVGFWDVWGKIGFNRQETVWIWFRLSQIIGQTY